MEKSDSKPEKYSPQAFRDEFHKFISGKKAAAEGHPPKPEQQPLAGVSDIEKSVVSATKTCSVKLVDIGPKTTPTINAVASTNNSDHNNITDESSGDSQVETLKRDHLPPHSLETSDDSDEPNPKRVRPSLPEPGRVLLKPKDFIDLKKRTVSSSSLDSSRLKSTKPTSEGGHKSSTSSAFDNVEEELGRLFGASSPQKKDNNSSKVTISPVRSSSSNTKETELCKSGANNSSSSSSSSMMMSSSPMNTTTNNTPNSTSSSSGSVTITKLSTGSSLSVESKDLKTILSSSGGNRALSTSGNNSSSVKSSSNTNSSNNLENGFKLNKKNVDIVSMSGSSTTNSNKDQLSPTDR